MAHFTGLNLHSQRASRENKVWQIFKNYNNILWYTKAYNIVDRAILIEKLQNYNIPINTVYTIKDMLDKFILNYEGQEIKTQRGLVQGSVFSPFLFNLYINDLMWYLEFEKIKSWA